MRRFVMGAAAAATLAGVGLAGTGGAAHAADFGGYGGGGYKDEPVYAAPFSWTGFYIGGHGGGGWGDSDWDWNSVTLYGKGPLPGAVYNRYDGGSSPSGGLGGIQAGYNLQLQNLVLGLEGSLSWASLEDSYTVDTITSTTEITWLGDVSLRAGLALDRLLIFAKTGVAWGGFEHDAIGSFNVPWHAATDNQVGWLIGGGLEFALSNAWSAKVEYNYIDFFDNGSFVLGSNLGQAGIGADQSVSVVKAGLNYRFGSGGFAPLK